jgi:hypothetical protein
MDCSNNNCSSCISDILKRILLLQKQESSCESFSGCDKPFLGPIIQSTCYNTRPIMLYNCATGNPWSFEYTNSAGTTATTNVFRVEAVDGCCCTCRLLDSSTDTYTSTNNFVTIDLKCCGSVRCLSDTFIDLC